MSDNLRKSTMKDLSTKLMELLPADQIKKLSSKISKGVPLWEYWEEFVKSYLSEGRSEVTVKGVRDALRFVIQKMSIHTIEECNDSRKMYNCLHEKRDELNWANSTFNTYRKNINTYFIWLYDMSYIKENNITKIRKCKERINEQLTLNDEQIQMLRVWIHQRRQTRFCRWRNLFFIELLILTAARPCELLEMEFRHLRRQEETYIATIQGHKQKGKARYYRLPSSIRDSFEMYSKIRRELGRHETSLFLSQSKRTGWTEKGMRNLFKRLSNELGFKITAYSIRRYVPTKLNSAGVAIQDIAEHLGHTRITTTKRYIERSCGLTNKSVNVLKDSLGL